MRRAEELKGWIRQYLRAEPPRSKSLMVTVLGDAIAPRGGGLWLSELIALLRPFHMNERLVRTSAFRLAEEGWVEAQRQGRRSRYVLTGAGAQRIETAGRRIYEPPPRLWDGRWTMVILSGAGNRAEERAELRRELEWEGFGALAPGVVLHPCADREALAAILDRLKLRQDVVVLETREVPGLGALPSRQLLSECWKFDELRGLYERFVRRFEPVAAMLERESDPQLAFVAQTLLMHAYRRVVLHDPRFPLELLAADWPGMRAYELCRTIYACTFARTDAYLKLELEEAGSKAGDRRVARRFGGLA